MKITITSVFQILKGPKTPGSISGRAILPASCEALADHNVVTIEHPHGSFKITGDRFRELVNNETIKIVEP